MRGGRRRPRGDDGDDYERRPARSRRRPDVEPTAYQWQQINRVLWWLLRRSHTPGLIARTATILRAAPDAPELERKAGGLANPAMIGKKVKCTGPCRRQYIASPEDPYLNATTRTDGICASCLVLADSRLNDALPVLTGKVVPRSKRGGAQ